MKLTKKSSKKLLALNLTSLIDVLFILIIFFAVSSTFLEQPGIELKLPEAESSESYTTQKIILYIDKSNNLFLNDQLITINTMIEEMNKLGKISAENSIVLKADKEVTHGEIIRIMDILRKNKYYKIVISTHVPE
jgi:biopolymer transport protein ExbD